MSGYVGGVKILLTEWGPFGPGLECINKNVGFDRLNSWWNYIYLLKYCYWKYLGLLESKIIIYLNNTFDCWNAEFL